MLAKTSSDWTFSNASGVPLANCGEAHLEKKPGQGNHPWPGKLKPPQKPHGPPNSNLPHPRPLIEVIPSSAESSDDDRVSQNSAIP
jgi:hypothetical protein